MSYEILEKSYSTLTEEQQLIVYNLVLSLEKLNEKKIQKNESSGNLQTKALQSFQITGK